MRDNMVYRHLLLLSTLLVLGASQEKSDDLAKPSVIIANPGQKISLKCGIQNIKGEVDLQKLLIQWFHRGKSIAEFDDKISIADPRMSMSLDAIKKGDGTLTIESFKVEDAGFYRCYLTYGLDTAIKQTELKANVMAVAEAEDEVLTTCETVLDKKLDQIITLLANFDRRLEELSKAFKP